MQSKATTVAGYLKELPADRRKALSKLRTVIRKAAPKAVEEMQYGMIAYTMGEPILALASQKNYMAFYACYTDVVGKYGSSLGKLNCGKSCIRFNRLEDLPLDVVAKIVKDTVKASRAKQQSNNR